MTLLDRIKTAYTTTETLPDRLDCYQPLTVLYKVEFGTHPSAATLQEWLLTTVFGGTDKLNGFLVGFGCDVPCSPSNGQDFKDGFHMGRTLARELDC